MISFIFVFKHCEKRKGHLQFVDARTVSLLRLEDLGGFNELVQIGVVAEPAVKLRRLSRDSTGTFSQIHDLIFFQRVVR